MAIYKVKKRNGAIVSFDRVKIESALTKAIEAVGGSDFSRVAAMTNAVLQDVEKKVGKNIPSVEDIQDSVEAVLIKEGHDEVARAYIRYRQKRAEARDDRNIVIEVGKTMDDYLQNLDWRINENANIGYSIGGMILKNSEKITANYRLSHIYPDEVGNAHRNADFHIHDLGMFAPYCAGWSLRALLEEGLNGVPDKVASAPAKHLNSAVNQMVNFLGVMQNEWAGAQAFSSFDTYLAPFVHKYTEELQQEIESSEMSFPSEEKKQKYLDDKTYHYVYQCMQNFIFGMNTPSRWGTQTPFSNITLDWTCPPDLKDKALLLGGVKYGYYKKKFSELEKEMGIINKALMQVYLDGDINGRVFTFPIPTYNITEDFDWESENTDLLFEMTAKYGIPYFQNFIGSQYMKDENGDLVKNPKAYSPDAVRSMCCRLQLDLNELKKRGGGLFGSAEMTGSVGVVTINMARIGYNYEGDKEGFKKQVRHLMDLAKTSLEIKRKEVEKWHKAGLYLYTKRYLPSFRSHFSTIGLLGMNEAILNFTGGEEHIATKRGQEFALEVMNFMREILTEYQEETGNLYNLEATPGEGTTYRFAREDQKQLSGIIQAGTPDAPYYTNSTQLPVEFTDDLFEAMDLQDDLQCNYTGGTVLHLYLGERVSNAEACKQLVKKCISNYRMPYVSVTPTFSVCPKHGYIVGEHDYCPKCDAEIGYEGPKFDLEKRRKHISREGKVEELSQEVVECAAC